MMRKLTFLALGLLSATGTSAADKRIQTRFYDPDHIVQIVGRSGIQSTVEFGSEERIENVAVGDSSAWQITPNRRASLLFLKPLLRATKTNMTVVTDRHIYMFDLVSGTKDSTPVYALKFLYPDTKPVVTLTTAKVPEGPPTFVPERLNFGWQMKGADGLLPTRAFDDGKSLYLSWNRDAQLPAILTLSIEGREGPLNYRASGDYIIIDPVPSNILLRQGKKSAMVWASRPVRPAILSPSPPLVRTARVATIQQDQVRASPTMRLPMPDVTALYTAKLAGADDEQ